MRGAASYNDVLSSAVRLDEFMLARAPNPCLYVQTAALAKMGPSSRRCTRR